ncbi:MAG: J domain-containing protein [Moorella sp. (in: Bacteria)]|nr:J domain-containing protein [Moorella sp. (in: firmicutes)]
MLGLAPGATLAEIKAAYRRLVKLHHPDAGGDPEVFMKIHAAYQNLTSR